jgi:hypothetical protein
VKSPVLHIPVEARAAFPDRCNRLSDDSVEHEQAKILHPALCALLDAAGSSRATQSAAACQLTRGTRLLVDVTVNAQGYVALVEPEDKVPRYLHVALACAQRAFETDDVGALASVCEDIQGLVDAAMAWGLRREQRTRAALTGDHRGLP